VLSYRDGCRYTYPDPYPTPALSGGIFGIWTDWEIVESRDGEAKIN